jgi:DNA-binding NarL/FixJ family response regulator
MPTRILLVDDHALVRDGLRMILETLGDIDVVGEACEGRDALAQAEALQPDVILMDISMPELNGIEATRVICERLPAVRIIILSMHNTREHVFRAMQAGARAYLLKESAGDCIAKAIRTVMKGHRYFSEGVEAPAKSVSTDTGSIEQSPIDSLSPRELEVIHIAAPVFLDREMR